MRLQVGKVLLSFWMALAVLLAQNHPRAERGDTGFRDLAARMARGLFGMRQSSEKPLLPNKDSRSIGNSSPEELIRQANYTAETHHVTTEDGYVLTLHRIVGRAANSSPVLLQHGLLESSIDWLIPGRNKSLPYILVDHGYDVWLANARGNTYSKKHKKLSTSDREFWDFSWYELGVYDLPAMVNYIWNIRKENLFYIGHSMGATSFSVMSVEKPKIAEKVKAMIALAPATYVHHMKAPVKMLSPFWKKIMQFTNVVGMYELLPRSTFFDVFAKYICGSFMFRNVFCGNSLFLIAGFNPEQLNYSLLQKIWSGFPAGTSIKLFIHWLQQISVNEFRNFDYGQEVNLKIYNSTEPPQYDLTKVQVPVAVFWSENDLLVGIQDVRHFYDQIPLKLGIFKVDNPKFNHFDFLWGMDAPELVYSKILEIMNDFNNQIVRR